MGILTLADGRELAYEVWGDPAGRPVFFQHGTGDSRLARHPDDTLTASLGVRLVTADRPGVGRSTPLPGRTLLDWVPDASAVVDALGIDTFAVAGWSGGGPHALAIAHELPARVTKVALASCLAPFAFASHAYDRFHLLMPLFLCRRWKGMPTPREKQTLAWVRPRDLTSYEMPPADKPLIPLLRDFL